MPAVSALMNVMIRAAEKAGRGLVRDFGEVEQLQVSVKGPGDFVSAADKRAEETLIRELNEARPGFRFLIEESGEIHGSDPRHRWIIDPLDGTTNFLNGIPYWCISIACEKDGEIIAGLIYNPVSDEMFHAEKGGGAFMRHKRLRVSGTKQLSTAVIGHNLLCLSRPQAHQATMAQTAAIMPRVAAMRGFGAMALDLAYVAAGRLDGFWQYGFSPWDAAAGYIIIREAGGFVSEIDGATNPIFKGNILAGNPSIYEEMKAVFKTCGPKKSIKNTAQKTG